MSAIVALSAGAVFAGDFRVVRKLASGGMGAVYVAEQLSTGRARALKLMHPGLVENPVLRAKFEQEARIGARIPSDHVVEVVAAGVDAESGVPWIAMELLEGEDLASAVERRGPLPAGEVATIFEQLCHALAAAHAAGIVHRDLKPENAYLATSRRAGGAATVKILDFGIARVAVEAAHTSTGTMGSPYWMAPEQTDKKTGVGPPADVWALGLLAFYLLTGKSFWKTANDPGGSLPMFLRELVLDPMPGPAERADELGVTLPPAAVGWLARCLARDPAARFPDARAAWEALASVLGPPASVRVSPGAPAHAPVQITPVRASSPGLAHARTVSVAEEVELEAPRVRSFPWAGALVGAPLLAVAGVLAYLFAASGSNGNPAGPTSSAPAAKPVPYCGAGMVGAPQGQPTIGADDDTADERPPHTVTLNAFCIDETEVTVAAYAECAKAGACATLAATIEWSDVRTEDRRAWEPFCNGGKPDRASHPANCVTFDQAAAYCKFKKARLPTEEEWEYAARGEAGRLYPWGAEPPDSERANVCADECARSGSMLGRTERAMHAGADGWDGTAPVGTYPAGRSAFGALDMAGNVAEWTQSRFCPYPGNNCASELRTTRGGSFADDEPKEVRASHRHKDAPAARSPLIGFRCAR